MPQVAAQITPRSSLDHTSASSTECRVPPNASARQLERKIDLSIDSAPRGCQVCRFACASPIAPRPCIAIARQVQCHVRNPRTICRRRSIFHRTGATSARHARCLVRRHAVHDAQTLLHDRTPSRTHNTATGPRCAGGSAWQNRESCGHGELGRCTRSDSSLLIEPLAHRITEHRCSRQPIFDSWRRVAPGTGRLARCSFIQSFCAVPRPAGRFPNALTDRPRRSERAHAGIVDSEANHGAELARMAGHLLHRSTGARNCRRRRTHTGRPPRS